MFDLFPTLSVFSRGEDDQKSANENYVTLAFVCVLNMLAEIDPAVCHEIPARICGDTSGRLYTAGDLIDVVPHESGDESIPDIRVSFGQTTANVEVKIRSEVSLDQLVI